MEVTITDENFENEVLKSDKTVLVDCWAEWCMPCKMIEPIVKEISEDLSGKLKVGKINVDEAQQTAQKLGITSIPTILIYKDGQLVNTLVGAVSKDIILEKLNPHL